MNHFDPLSKMRAVARLSIVLPGTAAGTVSGTPAYMAPEQWIGIERCDARTDIYAFGVLTFEILGGQC